MTELSSAEEAREWAKNFSDALSKLPTWGGLVFRGWEAQNVAALEQLYVPGLMLFEGRFVSASKAMPAWGNVQYTIQSRTGRDLSVATGRADEGEVVFDRGSIFRVLASDIPADGKLNVTLLQIEAGEALRHMGSRMLLPERGALSNSRTRYKSRDWTPAEKFSKLPRERQDFPVGVGLDGTLSIMAHTPFAPDAQTPSGRSGALPPIDKERAVEFLRAKFQEHYGNPGNDDWDGRRFERGWSLFPREDESLSWDERPIGGARYIVGDDGRVFTATSSLWPLESLEVFYMREHTDKEFGPEDAEMLALLNETGDKRLVPFE